MLPFGVRAFALWSSFDRGFIDSHGPIVPFILFSDRLD